MTTAKAPIPKVKRPGEYVALIKFKTQTKEGPAFVYMAVDGYSEYAFNLCVEPDDGPDSLLKSVYLLTEHPDFAENMSKGFTLVMNHGQDLKDRLEAILIPSGGKLMFHKKFHQKITEPLARQMADFLRRGM